MHNMHIAIEQERFKDAGEISFAYDCMCVFWLCNGIPKAL